MADPRYVCYRTSCRQVPFVYSAFNYIRCATYSIVLYSSVLLVLMAFKPGVHRGHSATETALAHKKYNDILSLSLAAGIIPAGLAGAFACHMRLRHFSKHIVGCFK